MKNYFINLFNYDQFANQLILKAITDAGEPEKPVQLMGHLLAAQQVWYNRCNNLPPFSGALWPDSKADSFAQLINDNHNIWIDFLNKTNDAEFEKEINYNNLKGEPFCDTLANILAHVINHGTHHRAQIGQQLKFAGLENLPITDYIFYLRQLKN
jgi:uncharacterized damage-inducible protein DinB